MKTCKRRSTEGSALLTVFILMFVLSAVMGTATSASMQRVFMARKLQARVKATAYAEAGVDQAYSVVSTNWGLRSNSVQFVETAFGDGTYDAGITVVSDARAVIISTGVCEDVVVVVAADVMNYGSGGSGGWSVDSNAFDFAMLCGGPLDFGGCGDITAGAGEDIKMHSNGILDIRGNANTGVDITSSVEIQISNNNTIDGDVTAPILDYTASKVTITGTADVEPVPEVTIPEVDLTPWYTYAEANGAVEPAGLHLSGGVYEPPGGVVWVNGDVHITSGTIVKGTIIATGDIDIGGSADIQPSVNGGGFSLASRDGDIKITTSGTIETGIVYAKTGNFDMQANGEVQGSIIVKGTIDKAGNSDAIIYSKIVPTLPGGEDPVEPYDIIGISAWQM